MLPQTSWGHIFTQGVGVAMALNAVLFARLIIALSVAVAGDNSTEQGDPDGLVKCLEPPNSTWMTVCTCRCCLASRVAQTRAGASVLTRLSHASLLHAGKMLMIAKLMFLQSIRHATKSAAWTSGVHYSVLPNSNRTGKIVKI